MSPPRLLIVGFEAMDRDVVGVAMAEGRLPHLARLHREGTAVDMANPIGMLTGPVWSSIATGTTPDHHNRLSWRVLEPGTYRMRWLGPYSPPRVPPLWDRLAEQGVSSVVSSVPTIGPTEARLVTHVIDWHTHDRRGALLTVPADLASELEQRFGAVRHDRCDHQGAAGELEPLHARLLEEVDTFAAGIRWLIERARPEVVFAVCGASHCAGHQFWHLHDPGSPRHDPAAAARLGDLLVDVYEALDAALGRLLEHTDASTTVAVVLSHGMSENTVLPHLSEPILRAIDDAMGPPGRVRWARELLRRTPNRVARRLLRLAGRPIDRLDHVADGSRRYFQVENFPTHASLRLNLVGREPNGRVQRDEVPALLERLEAELLAIRDVDSGEPVVRRLIRTADHYGDVDSSGMGDVLVEWVGDRIVERVTSPTIGTIERRHRQTRTGQHQQDGLVVLRGPGIPAGGRTAARSVDLWPTLAAVLGVDAGEVDGQVIDAVRPSTCV